jgi:hypothetical protein
MKRNLDGMYFRVERDGKVENVCVSDMTDEELETVLFERADLKFLQGVVRNLVHCLQDIGNQFDIMGGSPD